MALNLGIDTGGTHTDLILFDTTNGQIWTAKVATTPSDPLAGVLTGIDQILEKSGAHIEKLDQLVYGTTIVVNMLVQHISTETGLITTRGFRDVLEIGRAYRQGNIYDLNIDKPLPLVRRDLRMEVNQRTNFRGETLLPLDEADCRSVVRALKARGVRSISVCLLHSYANPSDEQRVKEIIAEEYPEAYVSLSSEINPVFREYERTSTTVVNAYVTPSMVEHLQDFENQVCRLGLQGRLYTMQANGGKATFNAARLRPVQVVNSGPVAGVIAGMEIARLAGYPNAITIDMGGTSCDVSLIEGGLPLFAAESSVEGYPVQIPTIDLTIVGAGGGSIAWLDSGGGLRVGPQSAGAKPGPVCYLRGGTQPTVTDANLVTGRLNPDYFLGGDIHLGIDAAHQAIEEKIAKPLGIETLEAAAGIIEVANATMIRAMKLISVERGYDPHDFILIAFGGAGPLHALRLAEELEIPVVIVPRYPGNTSALGLVLADVRHDFVTTSIQRLEEAEPDRIEQIFQELEKQASAQLEEDQIPSEQRLLNRYCDLRYFGQGYEVNVPVHGAVREQADLEAIVLGFHNAHRRAFGHAMEGDPVEVVNFRVSASGLNPKPTLSAPSQGELSVGIESARKGEREIYLEGRFLLCPVYERSLMKPGMQVKGPAIVEQTGSTSLILPNYSARVDVAGSLTITLS